MTTTKTKTTTDKPKLTKEIRIGLLLDESGSMAGNGQAVIDGTNEFMGSLKGEDNSDSARVSLAMFDERAGEPLCRIKADNVALDDFEELKPGDYAPRGMTPLNDAIAETIGRIEDGMGADDKALLVIFTDGLENASREYRAPNGTARIKGLIESKEKAGWTVIYLGANVDARQEGAALRGTSVSSGFTSTPKGTRRAMSAAASASLDYLAADGEVSASKMQADLGDEIPEGEPEEPKAKPRNEHKGTAEDVSSPSATDRAREALRR